jgi:hydrogenase maturation protein HypF
MSTHQSFLPPAEVPAQELTLDKVQRRRIVVQGIVQGVGFRPFVYTQAKRYRLAGFVFNDSTGVTIEVEGTLGALSRAAQRLPNLWPTALF